MVCPFSDPTNLILDGGLAQDSTPIRSAIRVHALLVCSGPQSKTQAVTLARAGMIGALKSRVGEVSYNGMAEVDKARYLLGEDLPNGGRLPLAPTLALLNTLYGYWVASKAATRGSKD